MATSEDIAPFLSVLPPRVEPPELTVTAGGLRRMVQRAQGKAARASTWGAPELLRSPEASWHSLAAVWSALLAGAALPEQWLAVRVVEIPKEPEGTRPLSMAELFWRAGVSCLLRKLDGWISAWMPAELHSGIRGRSVDFVHQGLASAFADARSMRRVFLGCKVDVAKWFDKVAPAQALTVLSRMGCPRAFTRVVDESYLRHERFHEVSGWTTPSPTRPRRGLLQGCPAALLMLNALLALSVHWVRFNRQLTRRLRAQEEACNRISEREP